MHEQQHRAVGDHEPYQGLLATSLFSGAGIGDIGFRAAGSQFIAMCEIAPDRAALAALNFPEAAHLTGDIYAIGGTYADAVHERTTDAGQDVFLMSCTAPCQGMSKSGQGTLLANIRNGKRPKLDPRNRLILPALQIIRQTDPLWVVFENVIEMRNTIIEDEDGMLRPIMEIIDNALSAHYVGKAYDVWFADYGIPQRRQRLITVYTRDPIAIARFREGAQFVPPPTHAKSPGNGRDAWVSVADALASFPPLDGSDKESATCDDIPFHYVPVIDPKKYEWIKHTPPSRSAFDNQCVSPHCSFQGNPVHGTRRGRDGINRAIKDTPLYCAKCGGLLPRPFTEAPDGNKRIMSGYTSAYKRMASTLPAPAITRNLSYPCSDQKLHPFQNRVLSLAEAMRLQTISDYDYNWGPLRISRNGKSITRTRASDTLIRLVIGESVPPAFLECLGRHLRSLSFDDDSQNVTWKASYSPQLSLW